MKLAISSLYFFLLQGCGGASAHSEDAYYAGKGEKDTEFIPQGPEDSDVIEEADETLGKVEALRCYLRHAKAAERGEVPRSWEQPPMKAYETSDDPCSLLPGHTVQPTNGGR